MKIRPVGAELLHTHGCQ